MNAVIGRLISCVFGAIGLVVIVSLWTAEGFNEPPLFFKLVGTLIASVFVLVGFAGALGLQPKAPPSGPIRGASPASRQAGRQGAVQLACTNCGAALGEAADVSPSGDVKCTYCQRWFNIHGQACGRRRGGRPAFQPTGPAPWSHELP